MSCSKWNLWFGAAIVAVSAAFAAQAQQGGDAIPVWTPDDTGPGEAVARAPGDLDFILDDGSIESAHGVFRVPQYDRNIAALYMNRFPMGAPVTIDRVDIYWPPPVTNVAAGLDVLLVAYYDADGDGDPRNATRLGSDASPPGAPAGTGLYLSHHEPSQPLRSR